VGGGHKVSQKRGLARASPTGNKDVATGVINKVRGLVNGFGVVEHANGFFAKIKKRGQYLAAFLKLSLGVIKTCILSQL
jgi:hypothetical protein